MTANMRPVDQAVDEITGQPGPEDLDQVHADPLNHPPVRVAQDGPVMVEQLPTDGPFDTGRVTLDTTGVVAGDVPTARILKRDKRRASCLIIGTVAFRFGSSQKGAIAGAIWPANTQLRLTTVQEVWVARDTADCVVSYSFESWTA